MNYAQINATTEAKSGPLLNQTSPNQGRPKQKTELHFKLSGSCAVLSFALSLPSCASTAVSIVASYSQRVVYSWLLQMGFVGKGCLVWFCCHLIKSLLLVKRATWAKWSNTAWFWRLWRYWGWVERCKHNKMYPCTISATQPPVWQIS